MHLNDMPLLIHSDGTLTDANKDAWRRAIPWVQFIDRKEGDDRFESTIGSKSPLASQWRRATHTGLKLFDPHLFGSLDNLLMIDSDLLFFERPDEIVASLDGKFHWNRDVANAYTVPLESMRELVGSAVPEKLNSGLLLMPRLDAAALGSLEAILKLFYEHGWRDLAHFWYEQTLYAGFVGSLGSGAGSSFSQPYDCVLRASQKRQITRHYFGNGVTRPRFFTEGVPRVYSAIGKSKKQHASLSLF
jgi:hypothetical protein